MKFHFCNKCDKKYKTADKYIKHYKKKHGIQCLEKDVPDKKQKIRNEDYSLFGISPSDFENETKEVEVEINEDNKETNEYELNNHDIDMLRMFSGFMNFSKKMASKKPNKKEAKDDDNDQSNLCSICMEEQRNSVFVPCGHMISCYQCAEKCKSKNNKRK